MSHHAAHRPVVVVCAWCGDACRVLGEGLTWRYGLWRLVDVAHAASASSRGGDQP